MYAGQITRDRMQPCLICNVVKTKLARHAISAADLMLHPYDDSTSYNPLTIEFHHCKNISLKLIQADPPFGGSASRACLILYRVLKKEEKKKT